MPTVHLGNPAAVHHKPAPPSPDGTPRPAERIPLEGHQVTSITIPPSYTHREQFRTVTHRDGVWPAHSDADRPTWVECDDPELENALCEYFNAPTLRAYLAEESGMPAVHAEQSRPYLIERGDEVASE